MLLQRFCVLFVMAAPCFAGSEMPFKSKEAVHFTPIEKGELSRLTKNPDFVGTLTRESVPGAIEKQVDVYDFKKSPTAQLSPEQCHGVAEKIVGPLKKITLQAGPMELQNLPAAGKVCYLVLKDKDPQERMPERHLYVRILNMKILSFVFFHSKSPADSDIQEELKFIDSLR